MRYDKAELVQQLAAEYAIGTLRGRARRRFERLMRQDEAARLHVAFWDQRLAEFGQVLRPVAPPPTARAGVLRRALPQRPADALPRRRARLRRLGTRLGLYGAGLATAAGLLLAFLLGREATQPEAVPAVAAPAVTAARPPVERPLLSGALPIYTAQMRMPGSRMGWLLSVSPDHRQLIVVAAEDFLQIGRHQLLLWCHTPQGEAVPLGVMPNERDATAVFDIPDRVRGQERVTFSVSLEPEQGPSDGRPSAMVLDRASSLDAI